MRLLVGDHGEIYRALINTERIHGLLAHNNPNDKDSGGVIILVLNWF